MHKKKIYERKICFVNEAVSWINTYIMKCKECILTEYIPNPCLFHIKGKRPSGIIYNDIEGRKFIIRTIVLKTLYHHDKLASYIYNNKTILVSPYIYNSTNFSSNIINYDSIQEYCIHQYGIDDFEKYLQDFYFKLEAIPKFYKNSKEILNEQINNIISKCTDKFSKIYLQLYNKNKGKNNIINDIFHIYTYDFLLDTDNKIWLLKINSNPSQKSMNTLLNNTLYSTLSKNILQVMDNTNNDNNMFTLINVSKFF